MLTNIKKAKVYTQESQTKGDISEEHLGEQGDKRSHRDSGRLRVQCLSEGSSCSSVPSSGCLLEMQDQYYQRLTFSREDRSLDFYVSFTNF
jgi:hypothetical protein